MKKLSVVLLFVLGTIGVFAQKGKPCVDEYKQDRTLSEMKEILMRDGPYYDNLRISYAEAINNNIGKNIISSDKKGISVLFDNTKFVDHTFVKPNEFENGVRYGDNVRFTNLTGQFSRYWAAMHFCGKDYVYAKVACINPQKAKIPGVYNEGIETEQKQQQQSREQANGDFPEDYGHGQKKVGKTEEKTTTTNDHPAYTYEEPERSRFYYWQKKNGWWAYTATGLVIGSGIYAISQIDNKDVVVIINNIPPVVKPEAPGYPVDAQPQGFNKVRGVTFSIPISLFH